MNKIKKWFRSPAVTAIALVVAIGLLAFAGIGGAQAALNRRSTRYLADINLKDIGVTLNENGTAVEDELPLANVKEEKGQLKIGKKYDELLTVSNSGTIDEYVRVSIYRYWMDEKGKTKQTDIDPKTIKLYLGETDLDKATTVGNWIVDPNASTSERLVLYYNTKLETTAESTAFVDKIALSGELESKVKQETKGNTTRTYYEYSGKQFCLEVTVDGVQDHHAKDAIKSAWGVDASEIGLNVSEE